jgi:hypothetical protein
MRPKNSNGSAMRSFPEVYHITLSANYYKYF